MEEKFLATIEEHNRILYKISKSFTNNEFDFDELYQEMLIQIWNSLPNFKGNSKISTWLYRVVLNTAISFNKKEKRLRKSDNIEDLKNIPDITIENIENEQLNLQVKLLYKCIYKLKEEERIFILLHLEGVSQSEIAEIVGITQNNVRVKFLRVKQKLQKLLKENGYDRI